MRALAALGVALIVWTSPATTRAWGMDVHRLLTQRAIDGLPRGVQPLFAAERAFISEHSVDPDLWRVIGLKSDAGAEDPNHFLNIDGLGDTPPFRNVPHEWTAYVAKYGLDKANQNGRLPWRVEEIYRRLVTTLQGLHRPNAPAYAADNARYLVAVLSHYIEDAFVPFHAVQNHDGQLTNQRGIHARFETVLVLRNVTRLTLSPVTVRSIANARDFIFATLADSQALAARVLDADARAAGGRTVYDDAYYAAFLKSAGPILERRMSEAASGVASAIVSAWEQAGRPPVPTAFPAAPPRPRS